MEGTMSEENHHIFIRGLVIVDGKRGGGFELTAEGLIKEVPAEVLTQIPDEKKLRFLGNVPTQGAAEQLYQAEENSAEKLEAVTGKIKARYSSIVHLDKELERQELVTNAVNIFKLVHVAEENGSKVSEVVMVKNVFDSFDYDGSGQLGRKEFESAVVRLLELQRFENTSNEDLQDRMKAITEWHWTEADQDGNGTIMFPEFLKWYSSHSFDEGYLLSEEDRTVRKLARQYGISPNYVESIKKSFEAFDKDKSSQIDMSEFNLVLHKALKVPGHVELPESRVKYFWQELDTDCSGACEFPEFLAWWLRYFEETSDQKNPGQEFYKQIRRMGAKYLDPPAYRTREDDEDDDTDTGDSEDQPPVTPNVTAINVVPVAGPGLSMLYQGCNKAIDAGS
jgi:Ca2+-binding EF-hand superfamily protein